jgi:hypothetical protein
MSAAVGGACTTTTLTFACSSSIGLAATRPTPTLPASSATSASAIASRSVLHVVIMMILLRYSFHGTVAVEKTQLATLAPMIRPSWAGPRSGGYTPQNEGQQMIPR